VVRKLASTAVNVPRGHDLEQGLHKSKEEDEGVLTKVKMEAKIDKKAEPELGARARVRRAVRGCVVH
jgi:hypothetical protein